MSAPRIPSLKLLMGFEAAARLGSFSRAAEELHLSQSAISHQINELEAQIKQPLFHRIGRGVELTVAGEVLQRSVQHSLATLRSGLGRIATYLDPGLVVLVCPAPLVHGWLQPKLDALQALYPELFLLISTDESAHFIDELDVDIVISNRPILQPNLIEFPFLQDEWVTVCNAQLAERLAPLPQAEHHRHVNLMCLENALAHEETAALFLGLYTAFRKQAIFDDARVLLDAALRGRGIACMPYLLAKDSIERGQLVLLDDYPRLLGQQWWLSGVANAPRAPIVAHVFEWLNQQR